MKRIFSFMTAVAASLMSAHAAPMASQPWVDMKLAEVQSQIETVKTNLEKQISAVRSTGASSLVHYGTNNNMWVEMEDGRRIEARYELFTEPALVVTNSYNSIVTNGTLFAGTGNKTAYAYVNVPLGYAIQATPSNLVWRTLSPTMVELGQSPLEVQSMVIGGLDTFLGDNRSHRLDGFSVYGTYISKSQAAKLKGGE